MNRLSYTFRKFYSRHADLVGQYKKNVCRTFDDSTSSDLIKFAKMAGVMHEAGHAYSIGITW